MSKRTTYRLKNDQLGWYERNQDSTPLWTENKERAHTFKSPRKAHDVANYIDSLLDETMQTRIADTMAIPD